MPEYRILEDNVDTLQAFIEASTEYLENIEKSLLLLETSEQQPATHLSDIFCNIHKIEALLSFVKITDVTTFSYEAESLLDGLRKNQLLLSPDLITLLLDCCDILGEMLVDIRNTLLGHANGDLSFTLVIPERIASVRSEISTLLSRERSTAEKETLEQSATRKDELSEETATSESDAALLAVVEEQAGEAVLESLLAEAGEHTDMVADQLLIRLDGDRENGELLADLFRRVHTLKGLLGLVLSIEMDDSLAMRAVKELQGAFHSIETMLERVRNGELTVSDHLINVCFAAVDGLRSFTENYRRGFVDHEPLLGRWRAINARETDSWEQGATGKGQQPITARASEPVITMNHGIRVSEEKLDRLMGIVGEMVIGKNTFFRISHKLMMEYNIPSIAREVRDSAQWVARISSSLEDSVMGIRMIEVGALFQKFPRVVRDIALRTGKKIALLMEGEDTELDKTIIEQIGDPLMHLVRNAADHGIESVGEREETGKDIQGRVTLRAYNHGRHVMIEVDDDGRGMDPAAIRAKAVEKGFISEGQARNLNDAQALQLIFLPGFSTAKVVSDISGRGVGMDVVKANVATLKGTINIDSVPGRGSRVTIQLPLTLLVSKGLLVEVGCQSLVVPLEYVVETVKVPRHRVLNQHGRLMFYHRGDVMGVVFLGELLRMEFQTDLETIPIILVTDGRSRLGLVVDALRSEMDVLVKKLPESLSAIAGMGGATILGNGQVALVLNPLEIIRLATNG
jgi:two-component system chemotaxis sensor kinase CheA